MNRKITVGLLGVVACALIWMISERLGLSLHAGNILTIFSAFLFYVLATGADGASPPMPQRPAAHARTPFSSRTAILLAACFHMLIWMLIILLFETSQANVEQLAAAGQLTITDVGYQQFQLFQSGFIFLFWGLPVLLLFARWFCRRADDFSLLHAVYATSIAFVAFTAIRIFVDDMLFAQASATLTLAFGDRANPYVSSGAILIAMFLILLVGAVMAYSLFFWLATRMFRRWPSL